ncbi:MAG: hypothetical protein JST58_08735 [Bacteroidetes bacterium]|nr:hypothetical protein [Bacteroidota bacterium]
MESTTSIEQFQEDLQYWKQELSSIKQEICHFESHLENMAKMKLSKIHLATVEHFQNSFICQKEVLDKLRHDLPDSQQKVQHSFNMFNTAAKEAKHALAERMDTFRRIYNDIKQEFKQFRSSEPVQLASI